MKRFHTFWIYLLVLCWLPASVFCHPQNLTSSEVWTQWERNNPNSTRTIDHSAWNKFLKKYVVSQRGTNRVNYAAVTVKDKNYLYDYIWLLSKKPIYDYNRKEQLAYWINLYNASVVKMILEHYPVESVSDIENSRGLFVDGPWDAHRIRVNHVTLSLNDIKKHIILTNWNDHRVIYALSSGTLSAPDLPSQAFTAENVDRLLEEATVGFINSKRAFRLIDGQLIGSVLYHKYASHFGHSEHHIMEHIRQYAKPALRRTLSKTDHITQYTTNCHVNDVIPIHQSTHSG